VVWQNAANFGFGTLEHDPEKRALGLDPRVGAGFPKTSCSKKHWAGAIPNRPNLILLDEPHDREGLLTE